MSLILALDLGTSSVKALLMDKHGEVLHVHSEPYPTHTIRPGWSEQHPEDWVKAAVQAAAVCLKNVSDKDVSIISLSGHMSGLVLINEGGEPLLPCIPLSDTRSALQTERLRQRLSDKIARITGNPVIDAFMAPKLLWVIEQHPELYARTNCLLFPKDYLRYRLTGLLATDPTDAGNSLFFDSAEQNWNAELVEEMGIRANILPQIKKSGDIAGFLTKPMAGLLGLPSGIPVAVGAADMAAGALGTGAVEPGDTTLTIGTSATLISVVDKLDEQAAGQITFHPHAISGLMYALGSHFSGGLSLNWLSSLLHGTVNYNQLQELGRMAQAVQAGSDGVLFLPFLTGSGSPHFNASMRASFHGLSASTGQAAMFRAVLEGIAYNLKETLSLVERLSNGVIDSIRVGGGGAKLGIWPEILAAVFGKSVRLLAQADASAMGAAMIGGYAAGIFPDLKEVARRLSQPMMTITPDASAALEYDRLYKRYLIVYRHMENLGCELEKLSQKGTII